MPEPELNLTVDYHSLVSQLQGPILVSGASGFVGANLLRSLLAVRPDVVGTSTGEPAWRLRGVPEPHVRIMDANDPRQSERLLDEVRPRTIFDCIAYGAYPFQTDTPRIYETNFARLTRLLPSLVDRNLSAYIHAGSSSEYGTNCAGPAEDAVLAPNSDYAVSKVAAGSLIHFYGRKKQLPCANLRLYSIYGPLEEASRLIPQLIMQGSEGHLPPFVAPQVGRDFLYIADAIRAFFQAAIHLSESHWGDSFNVGTGQEHSMAMVAHEAKRLFGITAEPSFTMPCRSWDVAHWYATVAKAKAVLHWEPSTTLRQGLTMTKAWYSSLANPGEYRGSSKQLGKS